MQELRNDLLDTLESANESLKEIQDDKIKNVCQELFKLTINSIIKRIDDELLEMEKQQIIDFADEYGTYLLKGGTMSAASYNETFKSE